MQNCCSILTAKTPVVQLLTWDKVLWITVSLQASTGRYDDTYVK